jgi:hypothetical protein
MDPKKVIIYNKQYFHYEIIESIINKYHLLYNLNPAVNNYSNDKIYLKISRNKSFRNYMQNKYPKIKFCTLDEEINDYDYFINATIYPKDLPDLNLKDPRHVFISHEVDNETIQHSNIFYLTPLCGNRNYFYADVLPYQDQTIRTSTPVYIIQGQINWEKRNYELLNILLNHQFERNFKIRIVGETCPAKFKYGIGSKLIDRSKLEFKLNLNFQDYNKQFLDAYCILPLVNKEKQPKYYSNKLTSTISYAKGYNLKCLIDDELQKIYGLNDAFVYKSNNANDFVSEFRKTLQLF